MNTRKNTLALDNTLCDPEVWVDECGDSLYRYALLRLRDRKLAEDVVQETFLAALQSRHTFAGQSLERTWLIGILRHKIADHFRRTSRETCFDHVEFESDDPEEAFMTTGESVGQWREDHAPAEWTADPSIAFEQKEFWQTLDRCLSTLPPRLAQVFVLREIDEWSTDDICQQLDISPNNLWVMLHRARMQLRRCLESSYFGRKTAPVRTRVVAGQPQIGSHQYHTCQ